MDVNLRKHQLDVLDRIKNGCIVKGGVGSGKTRTALAYYFTKECGGSLRINSKGTNGPFKDPKDILVFTTAKKRDDIDWEKEASNFSISTDPENSFGGVSIKVDSWNNITNYTEVEGKFVIFDEQRLVGSGAWVKAFYKIAKKNRWIMLSATPGDNWLDYIPVFVANGFYKNKTEFVRRHVIYNQYSKFPKVDDYREKGRLNKLRRAIVVDMPYEYHTKRHLKNVPVEHDPDILKKIMTERWNHIAERPIKNIAELFYLSRRVVNSHDSRVDKLISIHGEHQRLIVFYNFNYELDILVNLAESLGIKYAQWNGKKHEPVPKGENWLYFVQYTAGAEGWNCIETNAILFFSLNYSYKIFEQSQGRIDRLNTPYINLYYYILRSNSWIDRAIWKALLYKKNFNESSYQL